LAYSEMGFVALLAGVTMAAMALDERAPRLSAWLRQPGTIQGVCAAAAAAAVFYYARRTATTFIYFQF
jgi:uncharacterized membrane protein HdeD (DUF308 family)